MTPHPPPDGVRFEPTPAGFRLRARCLSFVDTVMRVGLAGVVSSLPFVLWGDLIREAWTWCSPTPGAPEG